jgi:hypothetical protein
MMKQKMGARASLRGFSKNKEFNQVSGKMRKRDFYRYILGPLKQKIALRF